MREFRFRTMLGLVAVVIAWTAGAHASAYCWKECINWDVWGQCVEWEPEWRCDNDVYSVVIDFILDEDP
jgi:hypothetical protein